MTTKADYTAEEWAAVREAPALVGFAVIASDPNSPLGIAKELVALVEAERAVDAQDSTNELIRAVLADLGLPTEDAPEPRTPGAQGDTPHATPQPADATAQAKDVARPKDLAQAKDDALALCGQVAAILAAKAPATEADGYKHWLLAIARRVAEAAKEEGVFGIGSAWVSQQEVAMLAELADALGLPRDT
jgi:hypothetical protein